MILSDKNRKCSTKEAALWKKPHRGKTLPTCCLQHYWQRSWCHFFVQFDMPVFDRVIMLGSWEIFWWRNAISACCVSLTNLPIFWTNIFLRVYGVCSANYFLTNIFTHAKLHKHVRLILINSLANIFPQFVPVYKVMNTRFYDWFLVIFLINNVSEILDTNQLWKSQREAP